MATKIPSQTVLRSSASPTIGVIAQVAGVSKSTVSLALRNSGKIHKETCYRIQAVARDLNYRPNPLVAAQMSHIRLNNKRKMTPAIGFLHTWSGKRDTESSHWKSVLRCYQGAKHRADELGFTLEMVDFDLARYSFQRIQQVLRSRGMEGIVLAPTDCTAQYLNLDWSEYTLVAIGNPRGVSAVNRVSYDHFSCIEQVMELVKERGYERIGLVIDERTEVQTGHLISGGFLEYQSRVLAQSNRVPLLKLERRGEAFETDQGDELRHWFCQHRPEAIIGVRDEPKRKLQRWGYKSPDDFGYVALSWNNQLDGVTGYHQSMRKAGAAAIDSVASRLYQNERGLPEHPTTTLLLGALVEGETLPGPLVQLRPATEPLVR